MPRNQLTPLISMAMNPWGQPIEHVPEFSRSTEPIENTGLEVNTRVHRGAQERAYTPSRS